MSRPSVHRRPRFSFDISFMPDILSLELELEYLPPKLAGGESCT